MKFNEKRYLADLNNYLDRELTRICTLTEEIMVGVIAMLPDSGSHDSVGASEWRLDVIENIKHLIKFTSKKVKVQVGLIDVDELNAMRGLLINYGMGVTLDQSNENLQEYLMTDDYNKTRDNYKVYTRPNEDVFDYETGLYLESEAKSRYEIKPFWQNPSHFYEQAYQIFTIEVDQLLKRIIDDVNPLNYIK